MCQGDLGARSASAGAGWGAEQDEEIARCLMRSVTEPLHDQAETPKGDHPGLAEAIDRWPDGAAVNGLGGEPTGGQHVAREVEIRRPHRRYHAAAHAG